MSAKKSEGSVHHILDDEEIIIHSEPGWQDLSGSMPYDQYHVCKFMMGFMYANKNFWYHSLALWLNG